MTDRYAGGELLAEVVRSEFVEGRHFGSVVVLGPDGEVVTWAGDVTGPVFPRSSNKPMQAVGMLRAGLDLTDDADLALVCASHHGEPFHLERVRAMLAAGGIDAAELRTPPDYPLAESARDEVIRAGGGREPIQMNCSGKHTGMLLTCAVNGWAYDDYRSPSHPLQRQLGSCVAELAGETVRDLGVDGCGAPIFALSLRGLAVAFLRLVSAAPGTVERRVADAMRAHPELVSGTLGEDTRLMRGVPGLLSKGGAEGVQAVAVPGVGAVAIKIDDGAMRARMPVLVSALRRLGVTGGVLDGHAETPLLGGGRPVGSVRAVW
ncbi:asparaginase [Planosporangium mesophilum]|uniref:Asparaginase n=1 Tax=Planosporangium mesophilum TaxID=689768 RepID=A0A8J3T6E2_9ACTN|nr:asparaginase [Planosporangium mesophilum]NJC80988.1 asparaginase [Planosporangium mesophilum]GII21370.1 asparaginase [Planosporangium mesophilum]